MSEGNGKNKQQLLDERLDSGYIESLLVDFTGTVHLFDAVDSTSSWLLQHGHCGDLCLSEQQSAGRGRRGHVWASPDSGNIYLSLCWCYNEIPPHFSLLGLVAGIAVADALDQVGLEGHGIKWPNDLFWNGRKLGGILLESSNQEGRVVIGVGLNVQMTECQAALIDQPWVSLADALPKAIVKAGVSRNRLVSLIVNSLVSELHSFGSLSRNDFLHRWNRLDILLGKKVCVKQGESKNFTGQVAGIDNYGRLLLKSETGELLHFSSADVSLRKNSGIFPP